VKGNMLFRIIGKLGYVLVVIGFCMPITCDLNGFQVSNFLMENEKALFGILMIVTLVIAIAGIIIGILLLTNKKVNAGVDWITAVACIASGLIVYFGCLKEEGLELQSGAYVILAGWIIALAGQIISSIGGTAATALKTIACAFTLAGTVILSQGQII